MNYDEALAEVKRILASDSKNHGDYVVYPMTWRSYGWVFNYVLKELIETGDDYNFGLIGGGPYFVSKQGEVSGFSLHYYTTNLFLRSWELSHPKLDFVEGESLTELNANDKRMFERIVCGFFSSIIRNGNREIMIAPQADNAYSKWLYRRDKIWCIEQQYQWLHGILVGRIKEIAEIEPREKGSLEAQEGNITLTGALYVDSPRFEHLIRVTSNLTEDGEELYLEIDNQQTHS